MTLKLREPTDEYLDAVGQVLAKYEGQHPNAEIEAYRLSSVSIHIRIVDPDFSRLSRTERHDAIWQLLEVLPEETLSHVSVLLLLTPEEKARSFASFEFDDPVPSKL